MRKNNKILLDAEEQLVFATILSDMRLARDDLRHALQAASCLNCWMPRLLGRKRRIAQTSRRGALRA
jgi:hypothetical protein